MSTQVTSSGLSPVIITGECGFVGSHLAEGLPAEDPSCQIHAIDLNTTRNQVPGVHYHACDITSAADVESVLTEVMPKTVSHVASPDPLVLNPARFRSVNVDGAKNLLRAARKTSTVKAFVYTSTSIHENVSELVDAEESLPVLRYPAQRRVYTLTKVEAEDEILAANRQDGDSSLLTVSIRPATAFGARGFGFLGKVIAQARAGKANAQIGPGKNYYDVTYNANLVDVHLLAAHALVDAHGQERPPAERRVNGEG